MLEYINIGTSDYARKTTVAVVGDCAALIPEGKSIDRSTGDVNALGIPAPDAAPTGSAGAGVLTGDYQWVITFKNSLTGEFGAPSAVYAPSTLTNNKVTLNLTTPSNKLAHSLVDTIQIWRTQASGTIAFLVDEVPIGDTSYEDNNSDASISVNRTLPVGLEAYDVYPQDSHGFAIAHGVRLFAFDAPDYHDDTQANVGCIRYSEVDAVDGAFPNAWPGKNFVDLKRGKRIRSALPMGDFIGVFEENEILIWAYVDDPDQLIGNGRIEPMDVGRGAITHKAAVSVDGNPFVMDRQGIYNYQGGQSVTDISEAVQGIIERVNWTERAQISGTYDDKRVYWFLPLDADTECRYCLVLDRRSFQNQLGIRWWLYKMPMGVRDCTNFIQGNTTKALALGHAGRRFASFITAAGYEHVIEERAVSDSAHPLLKFEGTTNGASAQVFTPAGGGACSVGLTSFAGCYVEFDYALTPEPLLIGSSGATTFTLAAALGFNIPAGTSYKIGVIKTLWESGQSDMGDPQMIKKFERTKLLFKPSPMAGAEVRVSTSHDRKGRFVAGQTSVLGSKVRVVANTPGHLVKASGRQGGSNGDGFVEVPVLGHDARQVQLILEDDGYYPWELVGYYFTGSEKPTKK